MSDSSTDNGGTTPADPSAKAGKPGGTRLNKALADAGIGARRKVEDLITGGRVAVNGEVITDLSVRVDTTTDYVTVDGEWVDMTPHLVYLMLNKPAGYVTAVTDAHSPTVMEFITGVDERVFPIGRLDKDTEGLLIFTNDGEMANRLMHPSHHVAKRYRVTVEGEPGMVEVTNLRGGINLDDGPARFTHLHVIEPAPPTTTYVVELCEGRKRQIRRMFAAVGHPVVKLERIAYGSLKLGRLPRGEARPLEEDEIAELREVAGLTAPEAAVDPDTIEVSED